MAFSANAEKQEAERRIANETTTARLSRLVLARSLSACGAADLLASPAEQEPAERPSAVHAEPAPTQTGVKNRPAFWQTGYCVGVTYFCGQSPGNYRRRK